MDHQDHSLSNVEFPPVPFDEFPPTPYETWKAEAEVALKGAPFEKRLFTKTYEGITLEPMYTELPPSVVPSPYPGTPDYLRGTAPQGYIGTPWQIAQGCDATLPRDTNALILQELARGSQTIHLMLDNTTRQGLPLPKEPSENNTSKGLSLATLQDMDDVLSGVDLQRYPLHVDAGISAAPLLGLLVARARAQGDFSSRRNYRGCVGADPLGMLALTGLLPCPLDEIYDEMGLVLQWIPKHMPHMKTILIQGSVYHNGGANAVQELGCALATGVAHIRAMLLRGFDINYTASQMRFELSLGANFFMEVAKIRAVRALWARIIQAFGGNEDAQKIDIFAKTSQFTKTIHDPYVNILRTTMEAFAGVIGGVGSMHVGGFDEAIRPGDELSRRIARNIQLLLQNEFDLLQPSDPSGGSWYVEQLTQQLFERSWKWFQHIEERGGMVAALQSGFVQEEIDGVLQERLRHLALRSDRAVGTNMYANPTERSVPQDLSRNTTLIRQRIEDVGAYRETMDLLHAQSCLEKLLSFVGGTEGAFMTALTDVFMAGATLSDVRTTLNDHASRGLSVRPISPRRWTEDFEILRQRTDAHRTRTGGVLRIFLANMGPVAQHKARADFSTGFMEVAGFDVVSNDGFASVEEAVQAAETSKAGVAVICSTDETYPELVPPLARALKAKMPDLCVLLAGAPAPESKDSYTEAGVDGFIHLRADCLQILSDIQKRRGMC